MLGFKKSSYNINVLKGKITLPSIINGVSVKSLQNNIFQGAANITHIFWKDINSCEVTAISERAF